MYIDIAINNKNFENQESRDRNEKNSPIRNA